MPPTNTDRIDQLTRDAVETGSRVSFLESRVHEELKKVREALAEQQDSAGQRIHALELKLAAVAERDVARKAEVDQLKADLKDEHNARHRLENELTALKQQFAAHLAQYQEWDKRRWGIFGMLIGAVLSLASGLVIALVKK